MLNELKAYTRWAMSWIFAAVVATLIFSMTPIGRDDSDTAWGRRSNLSPHTDALTGCQYLSAASGGLTPRRDFSGSHVGCKEIK